MSHFKLFIDLIYWVTSLTTFISTYNRPTFFLFGLLNMKQTTFGPSCRVPVKISHFHCKYIINSLYCWKPQKIFVFPSADGKLTGSLSLPTPLTEFSPPGKIQVFGLTQLLHDQSLLRGAWLFLECSHKEGLVLLVDPEGRVTSSIVG